MNEIDILTNAGLSRTNAEMVVALHTMATALGEVAAQQHALTVPPPATAPVPTPDIPPASPEGAAVVSGEVVDGHRE